MNDALFRKQPEWDWSAKHDIPWFVKAHFVYPLRVVVGVHSKNCRRGCEGNNECYACEAKFEATDTSDDFLLDVSGESGGGVFDPVIEQYCEYQRAGNHGGKVGAYLVDPR
jgi:hypothetical protein